MLKADLEAGTGDPDLTEYFFVLFLPSADFFFQNHHFCKNSSMQKYHQTVTVWIQSGSCLKVRSRRHQEANS